MLKNRFICKLIMKQILIIPFFLLGFLLVSFAQEHQYTKDRYGNMIGDTLPPKDIVVDNTMYSIKNRLNTRLSFSFNRTNEPNDPFMLLKHNHLLNARLNARIECNYGILNWLELGGYIGYTRYQLLYPFPVFKNDTVYGLEEAEFRTGFAPTFGINVNVHLLPFFHVKKNCRWELYLTITYGGTYLIRHREHFVIGVGLSSDKGRRDFSYHINANRYRQEYGGGFGGGFYFWKGFGIYAEFLAGQFCYYPEVANSYYTIRAGLAYKFMPKSKIIKAE